MRGGAGGCSKGQMLRKGAEAVSQAGGGWEWKGQSLRVWCLPGSLGVFCLFCQCNDSLLSHPPLAPQATISITCLMRISVLRRVRALWPPGTPSPLVLCTERGMAGWGRRPGLGPRGSRLCQWSQGPGPVSQSSLRRAGWHRGWEILSFFSTPLPLSPLSCPIQSPPSGSDLSST